MDGCAAQTDLGQKRFLHLVSIVRQRERLTAYTKIPKSQKDRKQARMESKKKVFKYKLLIC